MICPNCGKEYNEKMTCCISCGADLVPYLSDSEQTAFEPLIPEDVPTEEDYSESSGFVRKISGLRDASVTGKMQDPQDTEIAFDGKDPQSRRTAEPEKRRGASRTSVSGAARFAGSFTAAALMFAFIILFSAAAAARSATDEKSIAEFTERLDVMSLPAAEAAIPTEGYRVEDGATVQEAIYAMSQGTGLTREDIRKIYEASTIKSFLSERLCQFAEFIRSGRIPDKITPDNLKSVFSENLNVIDGAMGKPLSQHDINLAFSEIDSVQPVLDKLSPSSLEAALGDGGLTALRLLSSLPVAICSAAFAAAMLPLIRAINRKNSDMLRWGGGASLAGGAAVLAAAFISTVLPAGRDKLVRSIAKCAADVIAPDLYRIGGALAIMGTVMLVWAFTLKKTEAGNK